MTDLEEQLRDLGEHLDHPPGDQIVPRVRVRLRLERPAPPAAARPERRHRRATLTVLASVAAVVLLAIAIPPVRDAVTDIFGLGSSPARSDRSAGRDHGTGTTSTTSTTTTAPSLPDVAALDLETARTVVDFPIRVPGGVSGPPAVTVDRRVPGGLVALEYPMFTVVEVGSPTDIAANLAEMVTPASDVHFMSVRGRPAMWITGTRSEIAYLDRDGMVRHGATRPAGDVLLWEEGGVTYRVEGFTDESTATQMASSLS